MFTYTVGNNFLNMRPIEISFLIKLSVCDFQVRLQYKCMPKNLIFSLRVRARLLYTLFNG